MVGNELKACLGCQQLALCQGEELGTEDLALGRDQGTQDCATWVSPTPSSPFSLTPLGPALPPLPKAALSLQVAISPCQVLMLFWDTEPASCLGTGLEAPPPAGMLKVWEAGAGPGKTGHQSCLGNSLRPWSRQGCRVTAHS